MVFHLLTIFIDVDIDVGYDSKFTSEATLLIIDECEAGVQVVSHECNASFVQVFKTSKHHLLNKYELENELCEF